MSGAGAGFSCLGNKSKSIARSFGSCLFFPGVIFPLVIVAVGNEGL